MFPKLSSFMLSLLCLPHSSATVERVFSTVNRMKTKLRNRLSTATLSGMLHAKRLLVSNTCYDIPIPQQMLDMVKDTMYKVSKPEEADGSESSD